MRYLAQGENIAWWCLLALSALLPIFFIPLPYMAVTLTKMLLIEVLATIGVLAIVVASLNSWTLRIPKSLLLAATALIPIAYLISALVRGASRGSLIGVGEQDTVASTILFFAVFVLAVVSFSGSSKNITTALRALFCGGAVLFFIQVTRLIVPFTLGGVLSIPASSISGSWHDLAMFAGLFLYLPLALLSTSIKEGNWRWLMVGLSVLSGLVLLVTNTADVWVAVAGVALLHALYIWRIGISTVDAKRRLYMWIALVAVAALMSWGGDLVKQYLPLPLQTAQTEVRPSWQGTFAIAQKAFSYPSNILFGSGPNTFPREWGLYKPLSVNQTQFWNVDFYSGVGLIPTSIVTVGIIGLLAWGAVVLALGDGLRRMFTGAPLTVERIRGPVLLGAALYLTALHILAVPGPAVSALTFLVFGLLVADEVSSGRTSVFSRPLEFTTWSGRIYTALLTVFGLTVLFVGVQSGRAHVSKVFVDRAVSVYATSNDLGAATRSISTAIAIQPKNDAAHRAAVELGLLQLREMLAANDAGDAARAALQATLTRTIQHGLSAVSIESGDYQNWLSLAYLYGELAGVGVEGAGVEARSAYVSAQRENPTNPLPLLGLAQLDILEKNDIAAREHLNATIALKSDLAVAHFLLSQVEARLGDLKKATAEAAIAVQLVPAEPLGWYNLGATLYANSDWQNAAAAFEKAVGLQNNYANALFLLGISYYKLERPQDALKAIEAVAALNPADGSVAKMIADLRAGKDPFKTR